MRSPCAWLPGQAVRRPIVKWLKRSAVVAGSILLLWAVAWLAVPPLLKWQMQARLSELTGRSVTVGEVGFHPWNLDLTLTDIAVGASAASAPSAAPGEPLLQIARVHANLAVSSLFRLAPVIENLDIDAPRLRVARLAPGRYDIDDLLARFGQPAETSAANDTKPAQFALYNLQVRDGELRFDDRPAGRQHTVEALQLAVPFVSNLPADVTVQVQPHLAFKLNGAPFDSGAHATPFAQMRQGELKLSIAGLDLVPYLGYLPDALPLRPTRGQVSADLGLQFVLPSGAAPSVVLRGWVEARDLAITEPGGAPLLAWRQLRLGLRDVQPLARRLGFDTLRIEGAEVHLARDAAGALNMQRLATPRSAAAAEPTVPAASSAASGATATPAVPAWQVSLASIELADTRVLWNDAAIQPAAALQLDGVSFTARQVQWPAAQAIPLTLAATLRSQAAAAPASGTLTVDGSATDRDATLKLTLSELALDTFAPYLAQMLVPRVEGRVSARAKLAWAGGAEAPRLSVAIDDATLDALQIRRERGRAEEDGAALAKLELADVQVDVPGRSLSLGSVRLMQPSLLLARDAQGRTNVAQWLKSSGGPSGQAGAPSPAAAREAPWQVRLRELSIDGGRIRVADASAGVRAELQQLRLGVQNFAWHGDNPTPAAKLQLSARMGSPASPREKAPPAGTLDWKGEVGLRPLLASGDLRLVRLPIHLFAPYVADLLPVSVLRAEAGYTGRVSVRDLPAGLDVSAAGDVLLGDVHIATSNGTPAAAPTAEADELLGWQSLALKRVKLALKPRARPRVEIGEAALNDFYSRLVVTEQGRFNLQDVRAPAEAASAVSAPAVAVAPAAGASVPAASAGLPLDLVIGTTRLSNGHIDFSDHFVQPNYSAALTELNGEIGPFRSDSREMATLQLRGRAAGTALLEIGGQLNPLVKPPAMDIKARATDLELAPLSTYAGKYSGYAIERGKLSLDVAYKIDADGRLEAKNQLVLNQLTFGDKIESPVATKLPVRLAVALLKDRNGVIDINLPISGSVNDPQFSIGGIVVKLIVNLLVKIVTSPFAWLAGGGSDDLSLIEFKPGTAVIADAGTGAIDKVAKALAERPALKMTVVGSADPQSERDAYQRATIDARLLAERRREALREGAASAPAALAGDERSRLLKALYKQTNLPDKPRNALGFAKDLPDAEMAALLAKHVPVSDDTLRELALQRGLAVRDALIAKGLGSERLFLAAPKLHAPGEGEAAWTPRVQLTLSVN